VDVYYSGDFVRVGNIGPMPYPQQGEGSSDFYLFLCDIWNSPVARALVPDVVGIHAGGVAAKVMGVGATFNVDVLTRGKDAGVHLSWTPSVRAGEELGVGISYVQGWYNGAGQDATLNSLMGLGGDLNGAAGPVNFGTWSSLDTQYKSNNRYLDWNKRRNWFWCRRFNWNNVHDAFI